MHLLQYQAQSFQAIHGVSFVGRLLHKTHGIGINGYRCHMIGPKDE